MRPTKQGYEFGKGSFGFTSEPCEICGTKGGQDDVKIITFMKQDGSMGNSCSICVETMKNMLRL